MEATVNTKELLDALKEAYKGRSTPRVSCKGASLFVSWPEQRAPIEIDAIVRKDGFTHVPKPEQVISILELLPNQEAKLGFEGSRLLLNGLTVSRF